MDMQKKKMDPRFPEPMGDALNMSIFFDSDHALYKVTGRAISGIITMVRSTPVTWKLRRQGVVVTSMYGAEFSAMKLATEKAIMI
jgi:hypothetical protein